jgi:hypothetical protein
VDKILVAAITAAKAKEHNFAIVAKGPTVVALFVSSVSIKPDLVQDAKKKHGGTAIFRGKCVWEASDFVFRLAKKPTMEEKKLKDFITANTALATKPRFEIVTGDADLEGEGGEESSEEASANSGGSAPGAQPPATSPDAAAGQFAARLKALKPDMDKVRGAETSVTAEVKTLAAEVGGLAAKKQFSDAGKLLDRIEALVKKGTGELSSSDSEGKPGSDAATFAVRLKSLKAQIDQALQGKTPQAGQIKLRASEMTVATKKGDFAEAGRQLDQIEKLLKPVPAAAPSAAPTAAKPAQPTAGKEEAKFSIVQLQKSRLAWDGLRKSVQSQLTELETAIIAGVKAHNADEEAEDEFEEGEVTSKVRELYSLLGKLDERLLDKLDEALNAQTLDLRKQRHAEAAKIIKEYRTFASSDPILASIDANGFTKSTIAAAVNSTLADLASKF